MVIGIIIAIIAIVVGIWAIADTYTKSRQQTERIQRDNKRAAMVLEQQKLIAQKNQNTPSEIPLTTPKNYKEKLVAILVDCLDHMELSKKEGVLILNRFLFDHQNISQEDVNAVTIGLGQPIPKSPITYQEMLFKKGEIEYEQIVLRWLLSIPQAQDVYFERKVKLQYERYRILRTNFKPLPPKAKKEQTEEEAQKEIWYDAIACACLTVDNFLLYADEKNAAIRLDWGIFVQFILYINLCNNRPVPDFLQAFSFWCDQALIKYTQTYDKETVEKFLDTRKTVYDKIMQSSDSENKDEQLFDAFMQFLSKDSISDPFTKKIAILSIDKHVELTVKNTTRYGPILKQVFTFFETIANSPVYIPVPQSV